MLRDTTSSPTTEMSKLWKWVQYYINNWRLGSAWTQAVLSALALNYWRGIISWSDLVRCQRLLAGHDLPLELAKDLRADDLAFALSQIGRSVQGRFQIDEICGFVDQGVIFQTSGARAERLLCLTTQKETTRELIKHIPEMNRWAMPFIVPVRSVIKDGPYLYLVLSNLTGQPLSAWLMAQYPMGLPASLAKNLLKQIYQMLLALRNEPHMIANIHPGQLFIDPDSLTLQLLPFFMPLAQAIPQGIRGRLYQAPSILSEDPESYLGYRLIAIAYELFTGCVPSHNHQLMRQVLKNCEGLGRSQKRQMESCLLRQMNKSISLSRAAMLLDVAKKRPVLDATLMVLVGLFAISAITWQGIRYAPHFLVEEQAIAQTIVIQQDIKDRHVNLLKAAFFTQTQQANIAGARASWQALQQLLPQDDIFVVSVGPEQLARSYGVAAERMMRQDPEAAGVLVRAALRIAPQAELPSHVQALSALPYQPEVGTEELSLPVDGLSDEIIALTTSLIEPLPPLPPQTEESIAPQMVVSSDPCTDALMQQNKPVVACMDTLSDLHFGPRLRALRAQQNQTLIMTQEAISVADYNQYCVMTGGCAILSDGSLTTPTGNLDLALNDIEQTVHDYNTYCLVSGLCEPLDVPVEPIVTLAPPQIAAYSAWLSEKTGFVYRLPTLSEWQQMRLLSGQEEQSADLAQWLLDPSGQWITSRQLNRSENKTQDAPGSVAFYLVRETTRQI